MLSSIFPQERAKRERERERERERKRERERERGERERGRERERERGTQEIALEQSWLQDMALDSIAPVGEDRFDFSRKLHMSCRPCS